MSSQNEEIVVEISIILLILYQYLGNCFITRILDIWEYDLGMIEVFTDVEIVVEISLILFK